MKLKQLCASMELKNNKHNSIATDGIGALALHAGAFTVDLPKARLFRSDCNRIQEFGQPSIKVGLPLKPCRNLLVDICSRMSCHSKESCVSSCVQQPGLS